MTAISSAAPRAAEPQPDEPSSGGGPVVLANALVGILFTVVTYGLPLIVFRDAGDGLGTAAAVIAVAVPTFVLLQVNFAAYMFYWVALILLQNAVVGIWLPDNFTGTVPLIVTEAKTVSLLVAILLSLPMIVRFLRANRSIGIVLGIYFIWVVLSVRGFSTAMFAYGRNFIFPLLLLLLVAARSETETPAERRGLLKRILGFTLTVMVAGVVAESLIGTVTWRFLLNSDKLVSLGGISDTTRFFGVVVPRVAGIIIEPTNAGYIAAICAVMLILLAVQAKRSPNLTWWLMFVAAVWLLVESSARSGLLMLVLSLIAVALLRLKLPPVRFYLAGILSAFAIVLVYVSIVKSPAAVIRAFSDPLSLVGGDSTTYHFAGLLSGIQRGASSVIGHGLGVGGNFSSIGGAESALKGADKVATGGESAWGVLAYQTGIIGLLLLIVVLITVGKRWGPLSLTGLVVWSVTSMFAEASFGLQVAALFMIGTALLRTDEPWPMTSHRRERLEQRQKERSV